jgi:archaellin
MNKKLYLGIVALVLVLVAGVSAYILINHSAATVSKTGPNNTKVAGKPITVTGTIECLTQKNMTGPQNTSCAIGLEQDGGKSYALTSQDPVTLGSLPTGQKIRASGTFSQQSSRYDVEGIINVTSVERL